MEPLPLPTNLDEAENLILSLYRPAPPEVIARTQDALQRLQRSPLGWQFAHGLLERPGDQIKFFGALTIIIKLNTESSALSEDDARQLLLSLVGWFVRSLTDGSGAIVIRKLASALVTFFIHFSQLWPDCVHHLLYCLDLGRAVTRDESKNASTSELIAALDEARLLAVIWFITVFVEEVAKTEMKSQKYGLRIREETIKCLQNYSTFLKDEHYEAIFALFESDWSRDRYMQLAAGDFDFAFTQYGIMMIAFGDATVLALMESTDERSQRMLQRLCGLLNCSGILVGEDKIFVPALEFWATFVETMTDTVYEAENAAHSWLPFAMSLVMDAVSHCYRKIQLVDSSSWSELDSNDKVGWAEARKDVADFLMAVCALKGKSIVTVFVDLLLQALPARAWAQIEASLYCLGAISDCVGDNGECDHDLHKVFSSELFQLVGPGPVRADIPPRLLQTSLATIERYSDFFERHQQYLPAALELLFSVVGEDGLLGGSSSKSIMTLCSSCRSLLKDHVEGFLQHFHRIHSLGIDPVAEERIMTGISSIIQAIPDDDRRFSYLEQLISLLNDDTQNCLRLKSQPDSAHEPDMKQWLETRLRVDIISQKNAPTSADEASVLIAERILRTMASMARGMQSLSEGPIELDAEDEKPSRGISQRLHVIQNHIMTIVSQIHQAFGRSGEVIETICNIFRAGFSETEDGPFVFPPGVVIGFFTQNGPSSPMIGTTISTMCSFVSSLSNRPRAQILECLSSLLPWVLSLLKELPDPDSDPDLTQNGIDFLNRVMTRYPEALLQLQPTSDLEFFFMFALKVLDGKEPLPKGSACDFWSAFVAIRPDDPSVQAGFNNAIEHLGPLIARSLMHNIGGNASRSELDKLSDPLKKLVVQHPRAKQWLEAALLDPAFPSTQVSAGDKSMFLKKVTK
ncbi:member of the karyopherin-beta [Cytospora paraplurivora]|uniref:Member of the karyopherin-beta n=1 Tax=Cytospora paraplurivora TaxID=2898453 RepID=A0AAN9YCU4_9PEZI